MKEIGFIILGYLSGSILFSRIASTLLNCGDITSNSCDQNPGAANAFRNGGFWCGFITLVGDMLKGFLPVWSYLSLAGGEPTGLAFSLLLASPVVGHIFPLYFRFHGGKGIATTFGCLLGLLPEFLPVAILAAAFCSSLAYCPSIPTITEPF